MTTTQTTRTETGYQLDGMQVDSKPFSRLPTQQARTLLYIATGLPQKDIAQAMGVKITTIKKAAVDLGYRFNTDSMRETVHQALKQGVLRYMMCLVLCVLSASNSDLDRSFRVVRVNRTTRTSRTRRLREMQNDFLAA